MFYILSLLCVGRGHTWLNVSLKIFLIVDFYLKCNFNVKHLIWFISTRMGLYTPCAIFLEHEKYFSPFLFILFLKLLRGGHLNTWVNVWEGGLWELLDVWTTLNLGPTRLSISSLFVLFSKEMRTKTSVLIRRIRRVLRDAERNMEGATLNLLKKANTAGKDGSNGLHYLWSATFNMYWL